MFRAVILAVLWSITTCSLGFTMDRTALVSSSSWDTAPSLDTYQKVLVDPALNGKMQATGMDKILQAADAKISTKLANEGVSQNQTREKRSTTENIGTGMKLVGDVATSATKNVVPVFFEENASAAGASRNAILLLIDERDQTEEKKENLRKDWKERLPLAIEGLLQSCHDNIEAVSLSSENTLISESKEKDCDCEHLLRSHIADLLSWARNAREMTTGAVSGSNFSISFSPTYESLNGVLTKFRKSDGSNESDTKLDLRKRKRDFNEAWQVIDLGDRARSVPSLLTSQPDPKGATNDDGTWDIFDVFSKIRMAFFRSLLESLGRNDGAFEDEFSPGRPFPFKPTVTNLIGNTIKELKSIRNDKGYMLIAVTPGSEQATVIDLLQRESSSRDTLLVVTEICSEGKKTIPFVAQGPNNQILREARTIWELPTAIRKAIASDCHGPGCANRQRRNVPIIPSMPVEISSQKLSTRKHVIKDQNTEKTDTVSTEETTDTEIEKQARSSTSSLQTISYNLTTSLGVVTSILAMTVLTSS